jgi:hypothetical protein
MRTIRCLGRDCAQAFHAFSYIRESDRGGSPPRAGQPALSGGQPVPTGLPRQYRVKGDDLCDKKASRTVPVTPRGSETRAVNWEPSPTTAPGLMSGRKTRLVLGYLIAMGGTAALPGAFGVLVDSAGALGYAAGGSP